MDVRALHQLTIYMHEPRRMVLAPTFLYGSFYLQLPRVKEGWHADLAYRVVTKKHTVLNRDSLPCHPDDRKDLHDCIERYAQVKSSMQDFFSSEPECSNHPKGHSVFSCLLLETVLE